MLRFLLILLVLIPINLAGRYLYDQMESENAKFNVGYWTGFIALAAALII